jgi:hypothetical protein
MRHGEGLHKPFAGMEFLGDGIFADDSGLRSQRFDIVPETFEAALYLDLMRMLERGCVALRCSACGLPIPYDHSGRANKQRARSQKGQPIYHPDCFAEYARERKPTGSAVRSRHNSESSSVCGHASIAD